MVSFSVPRARGPLLIVSVAVIVLLVLRAFTNVRFGGGSVFGRTRSTEISMLTFNILLNSEMVRARMEALGQIVEDLDPDLITFQEVTLENLAILQGQRWFSRYRLIPPDVVKQAEQRGLNHFVVILSVYPVDKWNVYPFKNNIRKRRLVVAETKISLSSASVSFVFAATHLIYAPHNTKLREAQLKESFNIISGYENVCVMGDLNIESKADGDVVLPSPWIDAWLSTSRNTESNGYTVIKRSMNTTSYQERLDRVLCKLSDFKVKDMRIVGDQVTKSGILPSDHFGLFIIIEKAEKPDEQEHNKYTKPQGDSEVYFDRPPGWEKVN